MRYYKPTIKNGQFFLNKEKFRKSVSTMPDGNYLMILVKMSDKDEREFQKWYRVLLKEMSLTTGHSPEEMHELAKADVLSEMGLSSTTELDTIGWNEYIERLAQWGLENFDFIIK